MGEPADDSDRLKPCANCGGDGVVSQMEDGGYFIQCTNGMCGMSTVLMYACGEDPLPILMEKWNRRPPHRDALAEPDAESPEDQLRRGIRAVLNAPYAKGNP